MMIGKTNPRSRRHHTSIHSSIRLSWSRLHVIPESNHRLGLAELGSRRSRVAACKLGIKEWVADPWQD